MIRVDVETVIMSAGPVPSLIVLRERELAAPTVPLRSISIQTGSVEAASISAGINQPRPERPLTHDLMVDAVAALGSKIERVEITRVDAPLYYANVILSLPNAAQAGSAAEGASAPKEASIDCRPSDAIALASRVNAPIFVEDEVMNRMGTVVVQDKEQTANEIEEFDKFVQTLSPDDF